MVFFLVSLPEEEYTLLKDIFNMFESCDIKDQKLSRSKRRSMINSKLDCKGINFKPLRGISASARKELLTKVHQRELSFSELAKSCKYMKNMIEIKSHFMRYLNLSSWKIAEEKYPEHTKTEKLEAFLGMQFKDDQTPASFAAFCKHAKCYELQVACPESSSCYIKVDKCTSVIVNDNVLQLEDKKLLSSINQGIKVTVIDTPKV